MTKTYCDIRANQLFAAKVSLEGSHVMREEAENLRENAAFIVSLAFPYYYLLFYQGKKERLRLIPVLQLP